MMPGLKAELLRRWYSFVKALHNLRRLVSNTLPGRPRLQKGAWVSWNVRFKGFAKNVLVSPGAYISEDVLVHVLDQHSRIEIGRGSLILPFAKLVASDGGFIKIGERCTIHSFDVLYGFSGGLTIEDDVRVGVHSMFISGNHAFDDPTRGPNEQGSTSAGIRIGTGSWIGAGAIILDGVTLPPKAIVGAGAVVTKPCTERCVLAGVPARSIRALPSLL
jgi:acetyltransferase-like isoleucine patch superfamily enzyme